MDITNYQTKKAALLLPPRLAMRLIKMTDKELLELAAKASGFISFKDANKYIDMRGNGAWNPLTDDGDALRLACRLHINVFIYHDETITATLGVVAKNWGSIEENTRRAIVRAAAEIGKEME